LQKDTPLSAGRKLGGRNKLKWLDSGLGD